MAVTVAVVTSMAALMTMIVPKHRQLVMQLPWHLAYCWIGNH